MLVLQRYAALAYLVKLRENDKCELRAAGLRQVVGTRQRHQSGLDGFLAFPIFRDMTVSYIQKPLPYNTSVKASY